ncbi:MAG: hypothetical protein UR66_C0004G0034 [Candidatus Moranbacteria bacterium GW2011_GWE1_35_17]|nr:MAG: hypothetical protein UR66_C0004G0034 [Candidatus Moranbacteria bacterium GW2011_GWE1_35_17]KKP73839.1 MAG: hypothetical protein UR65_C0002G0003 [Candidatus Moranbacteria bacterium GW2011_GWE2_35_164]KKP80635.1 MAG: hypothetical protein UR82_C0087G0002 [Candidatus Moranbacteria bacterium GW2011_GWF1_35_5]KKP85121.1 MAG: hypothetical protein UR83_C0004G0009 [Candidatus Moranbacteria bacterium GW2011_GWF2_35_54]
MTQKEALKGLRILYPIWMVVGMFSLVYVPSRLIAEDAVQTANNILGNELLFKLGIVGNLFAQLLFIFTVILLYHLFRSVSKTCTLNMLIFALISVPIAMVSTLGQLAALNLAGSDNALMMLFINLNEQGIIIASIFWGLWLFPLGNLIRQSGYFPKLIGPAVVIGGIGYLFGSFVQLLMSNPEKIMPIFDILTLGEMVFIMWLVFRGAKIFETEKV